MSTHNLLLIHFETSFLNVAKSCVSASNLSSWFYSKHTPYVWYPCTYPSVTSSTQGFLSSQHLNADCCQPPIHGEFYQEEGSSVLRGSLRLTCITRKQTLGSFSLSYQKKDGLLVWRRLFENIIYWCWQSQILKSRCHTKRRMGAATRTHSSFGMAMTKTLRSIFLWHASGRQWQIVWRRGSSHPMWDWYGTEINNPKHLKLHPNKLPNSLTRCGEIVGLE